MVLSENFFALCNMTKNRLQMPGLVAGVQDRIDTDSTSCIFSECHKNCLKCLKRADFKWRSTARHCSKWLGQH